mgnify:CR=1 FL=1
MNYKEERPWGDFENLLDNDKCKVKRIVIKAGDVLKIPIKAKHQMKNTSDVDLVFIEVQLGTYFGEDDIVRLEDSYGRV